MTDPTERLVGQRVAVRLGEQSPKGGLVVLESPKRGLAEIARVREIWLEDVAFTSHPYLVVGTVLSPRPAKVGHKNGWSQLRVDDTPIGCVYRPSTGTCVRTATFAWVRAEGGLRAFGVQYGDPFAQPMLAVAASKPSDGLPIYGPARKTWRGEMGGLNYDIAPADDVLAAVRDALGRHRGAVLVDGSDDWNAPVHARPQVLLERYGILPLAWWHAGASGQALSGALLSAPAWQRFRFMYMREFGYAPERSGKPIGPARPSCGCWDGEGLRIYRP